MVNTTSTAIRRTRFPMQPTYRRKRVLLICVHLEADCDRSCLGLGVGRRVRNDLESRGQPNGGADGHRHQPRRSVGNRISRRRQCVDRRTRQRRRQAPGVRRRDSRRRRGRRRAARGGRPAGSRDLGSDGVRVHHHGAGQPRGPDAFRRGALTGQAPIFTGIPAGWRHDGGRIAFGPDGKLYVATGETGNTDLAQDPSSLGGKIFASIPTVRFRRTTPIRHRRCGPTAIATFRDWRGIRQAACGRRSMARIGWTSST